MSSKHRSLFLRSLRPFSFLQFIARLAFSIDRRSVYIYIYMYTYIHISYIYIYIHFIHTYCTLRECRINFWACFVSCLSAVGYRVLFWKVTILFFFFFFFCSPVLPLVFVRLDILYSRFHWNSLNLYFPHFFVFFRERSVFS